MPWSGPVAGAAPYQTPQYPSQSGYGQHPPYQYGQQATYGQYQHGLPNSGPPQRPQDSRPPKKKGNPIITRYPPPPGYRGLAQPQTSFHAHQHSVQYKPSPPPTFPQGPPPPPKFPGQGYSVAFPQQGHPSASHGQPQPSGHAPSYPPGPTYHWSQQAYLPNQVPPQTPAHPLSQGYGTSQASYQPYPASTTAGNSSQQAYSQAPSWPHAPTPSVHPPQSQHSGYSGPAAVVQPIGDPDATPTPAIAHLGSGPHIVPQLSASASASHNNAKDHKPELYLAWDDWDFDFDGAIWPKSNEPVDPNLSLGVIIWHPAKQVTRALPATFDEAEDQSLKPTPERLGNGESVSIYFTAENSHEAFLDVRQTDDWEYIKGDPAFVVFTDEEMRDNLIPFEDCIAQRDRANEHAEWDASTEDAEMREADWSVMDNLEQALSASGEDSKSAIQPLKSRPARPWTQEDILASLGVTGLPKPLAGGSVPFFEPAQDVRSLAPPPERHDTGLQSTSVKSTITTSRPQVEVSASSSSGGAPAVDAHVSSKRPCGTVGLSTFGLPSPPPPPPPPPPEQDRYDPWNRSNRHQQYHASSFKGEHGSPARSDASNGTAAGSDFGNERAAESIDMSLTPGSKLERSDSSAASRKRSYGDTGADDDRLREHNDHTKRKRRSLVDAAYGRR